MYHKATWVTVYANEATCSAIVRSCHRTRTAAEKRAKESTAQGEPRTVESAQVIAMMQRGFSYTESVQFYAGSKYEPERVWVNE